MSIAAPISHPFLTEEDQAVLKSTVTEITRSGRFHLDSDGLPPYAAQKVVGLLDLLADGQDVCISPVQAEISIAQAAKYLDLPESSIHVMLRRESFKGRQDGDQYWIDWNSLLEYEERCRKRHESLDELVRLSEEMGLYDDE